uniref:Uncharacterized protein n=1 Tax=Oryza meridionalis TaxID=40149 RepID=A0A0E0EWT4_9ORYZ
MAPAVAESPCGVLDLLLPLHFRFMPTLEVLRYLQATEGDLATVHLIEADCCTHAFDVGSGTTKTTLRCTTGGHEPCRHGQPYHGHAYTIVEVLDDEPVIHR